jgi:hypothetical protein
MTATLSDDSILVTDFDADPETIKMPITPLSGGDIGDRTILAPQELNPKITTDEIRNYLHKRAKHLNVVVIVPSRAC